MRNPAKDHMRIWAAAQGLTLMNIVSKENLDIAAPNRDRKTALAFWFLSVFALELIVVAALAVLR